MKSIFFICCWPFLAFAQNPNRNFSLIGGVEYRELRSHAWNLEINYNRPLTKHPKWSFERGLNFSVLEYNADPTFTFDTTFVHPTYGEIYYPNGPDDIFYSKTEHLDYSRICMFRLQSGLNRNFIQREKLTFSVGLNTILNLNLGERQVGRAVWVPSWPSNTYKVEYSEFNRKTAQAIGITIEPHVDLGIRVNEKIWFTSRLAYYVLDRPQLNVGCTYRW
jgi:hypothetical protein